MADQQTQSSHGDDSVNGKVVPDVDSVLQTETGGRVATGMSGKILFIVPVVWSLFQLWIASPLPFIFDIGIFNSTEARSIHLAFAIFLAFSAFPMIKGKSLDHVPVFDWILALLAAFCASYIYVFYGGSRCCVYRLFGGRPLHAGCDCP